MVQPQCMLISGSSFVEGVILYYGSEQAPNNYFYMMREQNMQLARAIARSYEVDERHAREVERFSLQLCDTLVEHGITDRMTFMMRIAAILAEVGKFVSLRNHSEHAYHIIMGTDLFGLSDREKEVVANVVFYHYKGTPSNDDENFRKLNSYQKIYVMKLVAILRLARALDVSHKGKISRIALKHKEKELVIEAYTDQDISLERWTFEREREYFSEIFGLEVNLKVGGK